MRTVLLISICIIVLSLMVGIFLSPSLPADLPSHWNLNGDVDGYMPKDLALFFLPILALVIMSLMVILPRYDPDHDRYSEFQSAYDGLILLIVLFLTILYLVTILWALGTHIPMNSLMSVMFGLLFIGIGIFFRSVKKTWFVGIRTPWTLLSEQVWQKTHQIGSWVFISAGFLCLGGVLYPTYAYLFVLVPILGGVVGLFIYSYILYSKENTIDSGSPKNKKEEEK
ncbi:MAG: SdpI family protein [Methanobacteriota archaeon]